MSLEAFFSPRAQANEVECPYESRTVACGNCGSPHFSIDPIPERRGNGVPGRCDDCGYPWGKKQQSDSLQQYEQ